MTDKLNLSPRRQLHGSRSPPVRLSNDPAKIDPPSAPSHATTSNPPSDASPDDSTSLVQPLTGQNSDVGPLPASRIPVMQRETVEITDQVNYSTGPDLLPNKELCSPLNFDSTSATLNHPSQLSQAPTGKNFTEIGFDLYNEFLALERSSLFDGSLVYCREDDKKNIVALVLSDDCKTRNANFICIIAPSGTGKSSVAHLVYNEEVIREAFDASMFIYTPENFDEKMLMIEMIESLTNSCCRETEMDQLEDILVDELIGKKILLVLDNAENENPGFWINLVTLLNNGSEGSVVLVTTNREEVEDAMMGTTNYYYLNPPSYKYCWEIFARYDPGIFFGGTRYGFAYISEGNPDLWHIKQLITQCENNPLIIKVLRGLMIALSEKEKRESGYGFTHFKFEQFWFELSKNEIWETGYGSVGAFPLLKLLYDYIPVHLKNCLKYFFLFPKGYILLKHQIIRLWISAGLIIHMEGREPEDEGARYFNELLSGAFIMHSPLHNSKEEKYIMHELIHDLVRDDGFSRSDDRLLNTVNGKCIHFSLVPSEIQSDKANAKKEIRNLETFLVASSSCSQPGRNFPILNLIDLNNLFVNSTSLRILDLSYTDIMELPGSIGLLRNLSYLGVSNSKITSLPTELCTIVSLRTLEAKECYNLVELPENLKELTNLRHLDVIKKSPFVKMPVGIGQLTNLQILTTFNVGPEQHQCGIEELKNLNHLRGCLQIAGLENIDSGTGAREANLKSKVNLETLCLQWSDINRGDGSPTISEEVFENLESNDRLKELIVKNYGGNQFPIWIGDPSFSELVSIIIDKCINCNKFPFLGGLPSLRQLSIQKMYHVKKLETTSSKVGKKCVFPSLKILNIWEMYDLEELFEVNNGDFPCLHTLSINRCPMLKHIPCLPSLIELSLYNCIKPPYVPDLPSLESLRIDGFQKIKSLDLPCNLPMLRYLEIRHCAELLSVQKLSNFSSLEKLTIDCCPKFGFLDGWTRTNLKSKRFCFINENLSKKIQAQQEPIKKLEVGPSHVDIITRENDQHSSSSIQPAMDSVYSGPTRSYTSGSSMLTFESREQTPVGTNKSISLDMNKSDRNPKRSKLSQPSTTIRIKSEVDNVDDGHRWWRKYGQKAILGNQFPKNYYKCTYAGCGAKRHVQRILEDQLDITYKGTHNHQISPAVQSGQQLVRGPRKKRLASGDTISEVKSVSNYSAKSECIDHAGSTYETGQGSDSEPESGTEA